MWNSHSFTSEGEEEEEEASVKWWIAVLFRWLDVTVSHALVLFQHGGVFKTDDVLAKRGTIERRRGCV